MPLRITPLRDKLKRYLIRHNLVEKFEKQAGVFLVNPHHPSLHTELLEPKQLSIYSFRIDRKYRAIFIYHSDGLVEIINVNRHYND